MLFKFIKELSDGGDLEVAQGEVYNMRQAFACETAQ